MATILGILVPQQTGMLTRMRNIDQRLLAQDYAISRLALFSVSNNPLQYGAVEEYYRAWTVIENVEAVIIENGTLVATNVRVSILDGRRVTLAKVEMLILPDE
jgi:hypothetical protein